MRLRKAGLDRLGVSIYDDAMLKKIRGLRHRKKLHKAVDHRPATEADFVNDRAGNIDLTVGALLPQIPTPETLARKCLRPSTGICILANGDVVLCCQDLWSENINEDHLEASWYGEALTRRRQQLETGGWHPQIGETVDGLARLRTVRQTCANQKPSQILCDFRFPILFVYVL
jgi:hypothetical protein